jgi:hypothetical protein
MSGWEVVGEMAGVAGAVDEGEIVYRDIWESCRLEWWRRLDSNQRPTDYETVALTT